jgi:hypothetical protein
MADKIRKGYLELRINAMEERMDNLERSFQDTAPVLVSLTHRVEKLESLLKQMQEDRTFVHGPEVQNIASNDKAGEQTEVVSESVEKQDRSLEETAEGGGFILEEKDANFLTEKMREMSVDIGNLEELLKMEALLQSFQSTVDP